VSFDFNVSYSSCWGYSLINTFKLKKKNSGRTAIQLGWKTKEEEKRSSLSSWWSNTGGSNNGERHTRVFYKLAPVSRTEDCVLEQGLCTHHYRYVRSDSRWFLTALLGSGGQVDAVLMCACLAVVLWWGPDNGVDPRNCPGPLPTWFMVVLLVDNSSSQCLWVVSSIIDFRLSYFDGRVFIFENW